jgi:hypothetical protein
MNVKASVATAILVASVAGVSACGSSTVKAGAATTPSAVVGSTSSAPSPLTGPATSVSAVTTSASSPVTPPQTPLRTDIPDDALLSIADLAPSRAGTWSLAGGQTVAAAEIIDPDRCDPVPRPQNVDPNYPRNPAWVNKRFAAWTVQNTAEVNETVVTYSSATAASEDFAKHRGWVADCAVHFQWTDAPAKYSISNAPLNDVTGGYAIRVVMDRPDLSASAAGSQGFDYMAVILRGNSLTVLDVSDSGSATSKPQDPGLSALQHDVQAAVMKLGMVFTPSR